MKTEIAKFPASVKEKFKAVTEYIPAANVVSVLTELTGAYKEHLSVKRDIAAINAKRDVLIKEMSLKYDLYYKVFSQIFAERSRAIDKAFSIIDKGLKENDRDLISMGLNSLSTVVASSPFGNLKDLAGLLESDKTVEI